jgi:hypothetical protein
MTEAIANRDATGKNMALECFLIHARNIRDFSGADGESDDVLARDFLSRSPRLRMTLLRGKPVRRRMNKPVAPISCSRARLGRRWEVAARLGEVDAATSVFEQWLRRLDNRLADLVSGTA